MFKSQFIDTDSNILSGATEFETEFAVSYFGDFCLYM